MEKTCNLLTEKTSCQCPPDTLRCWNYTTVSFHCVYTVDSLGIQNEMVSWCSIIWKSSPTMNMRDKSNLAISRTFRLRGWKLIWQHAFKREPGATGHTQANMCFYVSLINMVMFLDGLVKVSAGLLFETKKVHIERIISWVLNICTRNTQVWVNVLLQGNVLNYVKHQYLKHISKKQLCGINKEII